MIGRGLGFSGWDLAFLQINYFCGGEYPAFREKVKGKRAKVKGKRAKVKGKR